MVPLKVLFGDDTLLDWVDIRPGDFFEKLVAASSLPKTSQPSPADFSAVYERLADEGAEEIVSIHLTAALSGTFESATMAAATSPVPVHVVDTKLVTQATGLVIKAAIAARDGGADAAEVARVANETAAKTRLFFVLDTLDYLVKGGRAGKASGLAASVLNIKPILTFNAEGIIEPFKKVKGTRKALAELAAQVAADAEEHGRLKLSFLHAVSPALADDLKQAIVASGADVEFDSTGLVGSVIGTYSGPNAVGCAYYPIG
jgi:DegV family protein with EDD domain